MIASSSKSGLPKQFASNRKWTGLVSGWHARDFADGRDTDQLLSIQRVCWALRQFIMDAGTYWTGSLLSFQCH